MRNRVQGLQSECDLLAVDLLQIQSGERREYEYGPNGERIDITDVWLEYLRARIAMKRSLIVRLRALSKPTGVTPPTPEPLPDTGKKS